MCAPAAVRSSTLRSGGTTSTSKAPTTAQDTGVTVLVGTMHRDFHTIDKDITSAALKEAVRGEERDLGGAEGHGAPKRLRPPGGGRGAII